MDTKQLADLLGGTPNGPWINIPGPGHSAGDRSLGIKFDPSAPDGFKVRSLAGDDPRACREHVKRLLEDRCNGPFESRPPVITPSDHAARMLEALALWHQATLPQGTLVERYLNSRACNLTSVLKADASIRFHARCPFGAERVPTMIALMRDVLTDEPRGVHRTALADEGTAKREAAGSAKRMLGPSKGAAIKLQPHADILGIAEGIETSLSASQLFGVPAWALLSAGGIACFPVIRAVKKLVIFADHDEVGRAAAYRCAQRYARCGIAAQVRLPPQPNSDWNDTILGKK